MPSNTRWTLNPRKWFGATSNANQKRDKNQNLLTRAPPTAAGTTRATPPINQCRSPIKSKTRVAPTPISNDANKNRISTSTSITQLQLPAFSIRRERMSNFLPSTVLSRQSTFIPSHTEPSIRKNGRLEEPLAIDTTRWNSQATPTSDEPSKHSYFRATQNMISMSNMSRRCLVDYPRYSAHITKESSSPTRSSSSSSSSFYDDNYNSSSSGIYTDERQRTESKDTISTVEVLSIESIVDSPTSSRHISTRPIIHHYRRPMSVIETTEDKPQQRQNSLLLSNRSQSAEGILKDTQLVSTIKSRQSAAAIVKKIEKRLPISRSPTGTLERAGFVRIGNDAYRLTVNGVNSISRLRKSSTDSFVPYSNYEDQLRSAKNEECYATLPRTTSTEQLDNNVHNDLRIIVDQCIRPMISSIGKNRFTKNHNQRYKRSHINNDRTQLNIENITDKLLSSVDCSTYARIGNNSSSKRMSSIAACRSSVFDFNNYSRPPSGDIPTTRFICASEYIDAGSFLAVYMSSDNCTNQPLVMKTFRDKNQLHESYGSEDILASEEAQRLAILFNSEMNSNKPIRFLVPYIDECANNIWSLFIGDEKILGEPYLGKNVYKKFTSNFTYHITSGTNLVCDLQSSKNNNDHILTDPVICSVKQSFGIADLGEEVFNRFFAHHDCTSLCKSTRRKYGSPKSY
ncbi:unnamed protein product [Rotaria socialis]|uniref:Alpha-type protein kinase domain-containing protein n=2 Tax=Rotaria socialis TaxID=392032 RepID=A0A817TRB5_9BILA|nr:unnamed protein product [Rotaria socialis]